MVTPSAMTTATLSPNQTNVRFRLAGGATFQVGGARIDHSNVIVADFFAMLSETVGPKLDGIVGYNFLRHYKVALDYPNETLSLFTP